MINGLTPALGRGIQAEHDEASTNAAFERCNNGDPDFRKSEVLQGPGDVRDVVYTWYKLHAMGRMEPGKHPEMPKIVRWYDGAWSIWGDREAFTKGGQPTVYALHGYVDCSNNTGTFAISNVP